MILNILLLFNCLQVAVTTPDLNQLKLTIETGSQFFFTNNEQDVSLKTLKEGLFGDITISQYALFPIFQPN